MSFRNWLSKVHGVDEKVILNNVNTINGMYVLENYSDEYCDYLEGK